MVPYDCQGFSEEHMERLSSTERVVYTFEGMVICLIM